MNRIGLREEVNQGKKIVVCEDKARERGGCLLIFVFNWILFSVHLRFSIIIFSHGPQQLILSLLKQEAEHHRGSV